MSNYKIYTTAIILISSTLFSQSLLNGFGFGKKISIFDSAAMGLSSAGLVPSFKKSVSLQNPSTWNNLDFTYFSGTYKYQQNDVLNNIKNGDSNFGNAQFIVPIKNNYALGLGLYPYSNQYLEIGGGEGTEFIAYGDTLVTNRSFSSFGGITSFRVSVASKLTKYLDAAITLDFLFGSARHQTVYTIDGLDYYSQQRYIYSGSLAKLNFNTDILSNLLRPTKLYFAFGFPIKSISVETYNYKPFEDSNGSGAQDDFDFPRLSSTNAPTISTSDGVSNPYEIQFGFDYGINDNWSILGEYLHWSNSDNKMAQFSILTDQTNSIDHFNFGVAKFAPKISKSKFDRFNFRIGAYWDNINLLNSESINEYGISTGLSFNFGFIKNQIDLGYSYGKRTGLVDIGDENIQKFSIGITVGDIWFVKRRAQ